MSADLSPVWLTSSEDRAIWAMARAQGWADAVKALRDREQFALWWDTQPWAHRPETAWPTEAQCSTVADYLEALAARAIESDQTTTQDGGS